ncbi:MAG: hypothetical protein R3A13_11495 [Bdellovibrionota bacterium]
MILYKSNRDDSGFGTVDLAKKQLILERKIKYPAELLDPKKPLESWKDVLAERGKRQAQALRSLREDIFNEPSLGEFENIDEVADDIRMIIEELATNSFDFRMTKATGKNFGILDSAVRRVSEVSEMSYEEKRLLAGFLQRGRSSAAKDFTIEVQIYFDKDRLIICYSDGFDQNSAADKIASAINPEVTEFRGRGFFLVQSLSDGHVVAIDDPKKLILFKNLN